MADWTATVHEISLEENGETAGRLAVPGKLVYAPGQYFLAQAIGEPTPPAHTLFPSTLPGLEIGASAPLPSGWQPGMQLALSGPFGSSFHLPSSSRRVALAAPAGRTGPLLPLVELSLKQGADVTLYLNGFAAGLPAAVEVQPLSGLRAGFAWADYMAINAPDNPPGSLRSWLGLEHQQAVPFLVEVLLTGSFPCGGLAACGVCAVKTRRGYKLACKDGPVFLLNNLEL
ncbi:MAG: hypothetical protein IT308_00305 [Anaerolineaceae bacterium]|nr:hypothetical protein [Anaerolineaceae bacterium]